MDGNNAGKCKTINMPNIRKRISPPGNPVLVRPLTKNHIRRNKGVIQRVILQGIKITIRFNRWIA